MEQYIAWTTADGLPFDPWLRVHARAGARITRVCPASMVITGSVEDWEGWTGLRFPESGAHTVAGALQPVELDVEADSGIYVEPNVWMHHSIA